MTLQTVVLRYAGFAVIATLANLAAQRVVLRFGESGLYYAGAVAIGSLVGLVIKYLLDKRWIFHDFETGLRNHGRKFSQYSAMGLITTAIFWGMETVFWLLWQTNMMRELGAVIGLSIGYALKYQLDRHFVFAPRTIIPKKSTC